VVEFYLAASMIIAVLLGFIDGIALQEYFWSMVGKYVRDNWADRSVNFLLQELQRNNCTAAC